MYFNIPVSVKCECTLKAHCESQKHNVVCQITTEINITCKQNKTGALKYSILYNSSSSFKIIYIKKKIIYCTKCKTKLLKKNFTALKFLVFIYKCMNIKNCKFTAIFEWKSSTRY